MKFNKLMALSCLMSLPLAANSAETSMFDCDKCNFVEIKAGVDQPTTLRGSSNLNTGDTTYVAGFEVGRKFMDQFALSAEYIHRGNSKATNGASDNKFPNSGSNAYSSWAAQSDALMLNLTADLIKSELGIRPYVKIGAGISRNKSSEYTMVADQNNSTT